jgi:AcrR family transcriptional regulator
MHQGDRRLTPSGEQLLNVATEVFYTEGIRATSVDTLAERSGVSKPTLYAQFASKQDLVAAVLERRHRQRQAALESYLQVRSGTPFEQILAVFDWLAEGHGREGFRGCPFTNAAIEITDPDDPARKIISAYKRWLRELLTDLARQAGHSTPDDIGFALLLLVDGANARVVVDSDRTAMRRAKAVAAQLLGA